MAEPLPQAAITAAALRRMAADMILQAEALEASVPAVRRTKRVVEFIYAKPKKERNK